KTIHDQTENRVSLRGGNLASRLFCLGRGSVARIKHSLAAKTQVVVHLGLMMKKSGVNTSELGNAVRRRREQQDLSLRDVADKTGVSASTLSRIENGQGTVRIVPRRVCSVQCDF